MIMIINVCLLKLNIIKKKIISKVPIPKINKYELFKLKSNKLLKYNPNPCRAKYIKKKKIILIVEEA
jgi:retron-type reverse transcriptase